MRGRQIDLDFRLGRADDETEARTLAAIIETWRREYNEERPKKSLGGLTPAQYVEQLATKVVTMPEDSKAIRY